MIHDHRPWRRPWPWEYPWINPIEPVVIIPQEIRRPRAKVRKIRKKMRAPIRRHKMARGKKQTFITLVLDRSTSMATCHQAALDSLNEQLAEIKRHAKKGGDTFVSLVLFDNVIDIVFENVPAAKVKPLELADYRLQGCTALRDAMLTAVETMEHKQDFTKNQGFLVVLISDGQENSSGTPVDQLKTRIQELEASERWTFTYMLDGHSWEEAQGFANATGVDIGNVSLYCSSAGGTRQAGGVMRAATSNYLSAREDGQTASRTFYNDGDGAESKVGE